MTDQEYIDALTKQLTQDDQKLKKYRYCLSDWTEVTEVDLSTNAITRIAWLSKKAAEINPDVVVATVANQDLTFGLSRMAHALRGETAWENEVFRNLQDAETWIRERLKIKYGIDTPVLD